MVERTLFVEARGDPPLQEKQRAGRHVLTQTLVLLQLFIFCAVALSLPKAQVLSGISRGSLLGKCCSVVVEDPCAEFGRLGKRLLVSPAKDGLQDGDITLRLQALETQEQKDGYHLVSLLACPPGSPDLLLCLHVGTMHSVRRGPCSQGVAPQRFIRHLHEPHSFISFMTCPDMLGYRMRNFFCRLSVPSIPVSIAR